MPSENLDVSLIPSRRAAKEDVTEGLEDVGEEEQPVVIPQESAHDKDSKKVYTMRLEVSQVEDRSRALARLGNSGRTGATMCSLSCSHGTY
jgi:hypothetical protein